MEKIFKKKELMKKLGSEELKRSSSQNEKDGVSSKEQFRVGVSIFIQGLVRIQKKMLRNFVQVWRILITQPLFVLKEKNIRMKQIGCLECFTKIEFCQ